MRLAQKISRSKAALLLILFAAFGLRLYLAASTTYIVDEDSEWIPLAQQISLTPGDVNLPVRDRHPALPAYFIKLSGAILGENTLGYRFLSIVAALLTIALAYHMARAWAGETAALWTAVLLAFNEFYLTVTSLALLDAYYMLFALGAAHYFCRFLVDENARHLYAGGALAGLAFLCYEIAALLPVVFVAALLVSPHRIWLRRKAPYVALALFLVVISPDIVWNLAVPAAPDAPLDYGDQFSRAGGIGLNVQPFVLYGREAIRSLYHLIGKELIDNGAEYPAMNLAFGAILLGGVVAAAARFRTLDAVGRFLLIFFGLIFGFFVLLLPGSPRRDIDPTLWFWADVTLFPAALLAGQWLAGLRKWPRWAAGGVVVAAALYASVGVVQSQLEMPRASVVYSPQFLQPADGSLRDVSAVFHFCSLCDVKSVELVDLQVWDGPERVDPGAASEDVEDAEIGTDDRSFRLRATHEDRRGRAYIPIYRVAEKSGRTYIVTGGRLPGVYVEPASPAFRVPFWVPE